MNLTQARQARKASEKELWPFYCKILSCIGRDAIAVHQFELAVEILFHAHHHHEFLRDCAERAGIDQEWFNTIKVGLGDGSPMLEKLKSILKLK